jgi:hypothetical protein
MTPTDPLARWSSLTQSRSVSREEAVKKRSIFEILRFDISERNSAKRFWG